MLFANETRRRAGRTKKRKRLEKKEEEMNSMYCAEQINIPADLGVVLKQYTKAVIRDRPKELYKYSANFFAALIGEPAPFDEQGQLTSQQQQRSAGSGAGGPGGALVADVIPNASNFESIPTSEDHAHETVNSIFHQYDTNKTGKLDYKELPGLIEDLKLALGLSDNEGFSADEILNMLDTDGDGMVDLMEFRQLFFQSGEGL